MSATITAAIFFVKDISGVTEFYEKEMGLKKIPQKKYSEKEWVELAAGNFTLALHSAAQNGQFANNWNKLVFYSQDVEGDRKRLVDNGVKIGDVQVFNETKICDGEDPEGNRFQISNYKFG